MSGRRPKWRDIRRFCELQAFEKTQTDHTYFDKTFPNGETAGTKISNGVDGETVPPELWKRVWQKQLRLKSEGDFWRGLAGASVEYAIPSSPPQPDPLPAFLEHFLRNVHHYPDDRIAQTPRHTAQDMYNAHISWAIFEEDSS